MDRFVARFFEIFMALLLPPQDPPRVGLGDDDDRNRLRFRLRIWAWTLGTVFITTWLITLGVLPAVLGLAVAKHILVAVLVMALGVDAPNSTSPCSPS
jgi:hypothetical protein